MIQLIGKLRKTLRKASSLFLPTPIKKMAQDKLAKLCQGNLTTKEFFQQFNILLRLVGYSTKHNHFLINLVKQNMRFSLIKKIYLFGSLLTTLVDYRNCIIALNALERRLTLVNRAFDSRNSAKGSSMPNQRQPVEKTKVTSEQLSALVQT